MKNDYNHVLRIADEYLNYRDVPVSHANPNGAQILEAVGASCDKKILLQMLPSGDLESIRPNELPNLTDSLHFIVGESDRAFFFTVDGARLEWPHRHISGATIRKLATIPDGRVLLQVYEGSHPVVIEAPHMIDLGKPGIEHFITDERKWKLRVQGVPLTFTEPLVKVADAMKKAGFDPSKAWNIFLLIAGEPKKPVDINYIVDLRTPGIEKIRLMQRNIDNGEGQQPQLRREFDLLEVDERYLNGAEMRWETVLCGERRWLIIHDYLLIPGYTPALSTLALDIPKDYPSAQIDMFYFAPMVLRSDGVAIPNTHVTANINDVVYQGWSRHRNPSAPWDPYTDNVATHLALVEHSLAREFGE